MKKQVSKEFKPFKKNLKREKGHVCLHLAEIRMSTIYSHQIPKLVDRADKNWANFKKMKH